MNWKTYKEKLNNDSRFAKEYKALEPEYQIARAVVYARIKSGMTQTELATKLATKQSVISRIESGTASTTISFLQRMARALGNPINLAITP